MIGYASLFTAVSRRRDLGEVVVWILKPKTSFSRVKKSFHASFV